MFKDTMSIEYNQFQPIIENIKLGDTDLRPIGEGAESKVRRAQIGSENYAIKIIKDGVLNGRGKLRDRYLMTENKIKSGVMALGIAGLEQFIAGAAEDYAIVFKFVEGVRLTDLILESLDLVTTDQKQRLVETIAATTQAGLVFDGANPSRANAFYSPAIGFTLIDYKEAWSPVSFEEYWANAMRSLGPVALQSFARRI